MAVLHVAGQEHSLVEFVNLCRTFISPFGIAVVMLRAGLERRRSRQPL